MSPTFQSSPNRPGFFGVSSVWLQTRGANAFAFFCATAIWLVVLWGAGRSFDFTDEGNYYLSAARPEEVADRQTTYFLFGRALFALSGHNIIVTRVLVASLLLAATSLFVRGLRRFLASFAPAFDSGGWLAAAALTGSALAFSTSPVAPSYNLLNAICLLAISGLLLQAAGSPDRQGNPSPRSARVMLGAAGILLVADFFIKFSTSVTLAGLLMPFFFLTNRMSIRKKAPLILAIMSLGLLAAGGYIFSVGSLAAWRDGIGGTVAALLRQGYLQSEIVRYEEELRNQVIETLWTYESVFTALFCTGAALLALRRWPSAQRRIALPGLALAGYIGFRAAPPDLALNSGRIGIRFHLGMICALALAGALTWVVRAPGPRPLLPKGSWRVLPAMVILMLLPWVGAFGTSNDINDNAIFQLPPWLALIALLSAWLAHSWQARWLPAAGLIFASTVTFSQFFHGYVFSPYRVPGGRLAQIVPTEIGYPTTTLRLDPASHDFVEAARVQLERHGFKPGDDIFAFFNLPGLVFALGGVSPGYPWYFAGGAYSFVVDYGHLRAVAPERLSHAFILQNGDLQGFDYDLRRAGLAFPEAYERCGPALRNPLTGEMVAVWKPRNVSAGR